MRKKLTIAALSSVFVLGMTSAAMALHATEPAEPGPVVSMGAKVTIDGEVRVRGYINKANPAEDSAAQSGYDERVRLGVKAEVAPGASAYIQLENGANSGDNYTWGTGGAGALHTGGTKDGGELNILQAWINYQPGDVGVKVGHMPLALGNKVFFDHTGSGDDAIVAYTTMGNTHIAGLAIKFDEQNTADATDDLDGYVALITHKVGDNLSLGANLTHLVGGDTDELVAPGMAMSNLGLTADFTTGPIALTGDVEYQFGDFSDDGATTMDAAGWAVRVGGTMDLGAAKVGLLYGYGTGDDDADNDVDTFINFLTDTSYDVIIANYRANVPGTFTQHSGLSNMTLYQANATTSFMCPMTGKNVDLKAAVSYMNTSEDVLNAEGQMEDSVGTELDLVATWSLTTGLSYKVEAAWLATGDVWNDAAGNADDLYFLRHSLTLGF